MDLMLEPTLLKGSVMIPPSKSASHRAIICAALTNGTSKLKNIRFSQDILATIDAVTALGAKVEQCSEEGCLQIIGRFAKTNDSSTLPIFDCRESGSTLRFMIPIALLFGGGEFTGKGKLLDRPLTVYENIFKEQNIVYIKYSTNGDAVNKLLFQGFLQGGTFLIQGDISSQFLSGLLFALPLAHNDSRIIIEGKLESKGYVDMTIETLRHFGIQIQQENGQWLIPGNQTYRPADLSIEGDYSQAAFFLVANALGSQIKCLGLPEDSKQGDRAIITLISLMQNPDQEGQNLEINVSDIPDLLPILTLLASVRKGQTVLSNAARLRMKESDRLAAITCELTKLGAQITEESDRLIITGVKQLHGGLTDSWNDHRIAMSLSIASTVCADQIMIRDAQCVEKSYPSFWQHFIALGGKIQEVSL